SGRLVTVRGMVEKPAPSDAPSNLAVIGRYILSPAVLRALERKKAGAGGEIQLTDAIAAQIGGPEPVHGFRFEGRRYDCGSKLGFLQATVEFGMAHAGVGPRFREHLAGLGLGRMAAE